MPRSASAAFRCFLLWLCLCHAAPISAQDAAPTSALPTVAPQPVDLAASLQKAFASEQERQTTLENERQRVQQMKRDLDAEIHAYNIQLSTYANLLLVTTVSIEDLQKIQASLRATLDALTIRANDLRQTTETFEQTGFALREQHALNERQFRDMQAAAKSKTSQEPEARELLKQLEAFNKLLQHNYDMIQQIQAAYRDQLDRIAALLNEFTQLADKFLSQIAARKKQALFERNADAGLLFQQGQLRQEFAQMMAALRVVPSAEERAAQPYLWRWPSGMRLFQLGVFSLLMLFLLLRFRRFISRFIDKRLYDAFPLRYLMFHLVEHSLPLAGMTLLAWFVSRKQEAYGFGLFPQFISAMLMLTLFYLWARDVLIFFRQMSPAAGVHRLLSQIHGLFIVLFPVVFVNMFFQPVLGNASLILLIERVALEIALFIWVLVLSKRVNALPQLQNVHPKNRFFRPLVIGLAYIVSGGGLLIEFAGYGSLARYWYASWLRTAAVLLWGLLLLSALHEWEQHITTEDLSKPENTEEKTLRQIRWLLFRLSSIFLPVGVLVGALLAWGEKQFVEANALKILTYQLSLGSLSVSISGVMLAGLILAATSVLAHVWRRMLTQQVFLGSGLKEGAQASIATLSVYAIWMFGMLWALNALGIGTTTLMVAFGALGVGLGFGLQSIFNNFVSGLILLFERPIEVGNVLEINGIWGKVETINVRSTVIRTFDNSAIIIPNADILSSQLTNWTFKDVRMRRTIQVGVGYESNPKLVEQLLYEIAQKHPRVLTEPAPMVQFADFGDSALLFKLFVWTLLDYGMPTENDIRFEIHRIFAEQQISIAFPQLDVHLYR